MIQGRTRTLAAGLLAGLLTLGLSLPSEAKHNSCANDNGVRRGFGISRGLSSHPDFWLVNNRGQRNFDFNDRHRFQNRFNNGFDSRFDNRYAGRFGNSWDFDGRISNLKNLIDRGKSSGQLSDREADQLRKRLDRIDSLEDRLRKDGRLSNRESSVLRNQVESLRYSLFRELTDRRIF